MIVGTKRLNIKAILEHCITIDNLKTYTISLVPKFALCIPGIVDNQKLLVAIVIRRSKQLPYDRRTVLCEALLDGVRVNGILSKVYDVNDLLLRVDRERFGDELNARRAGISNRDIDYR